MKKQADSVTTEVPTSFTPAVPSHVMKPISNNHFPDSVDLTQEGIFIVCALAAPNHPAPFLQKRQRRTFWTACASRKKENKHSIEYLNCNISCSEFSKTFKATEVPRRRNQRTTTTENVYSGAIVTSPGNMGEPSKIIPIVETPLRKKVKREMKAPQAAGKHEKNLEGSYAKQKTNTIVEPNIVQGMIHHEEKVRINIRKQISKDEIKMFLISKGRNKVMWKQCSNEIINMKKL